MLYLHGSQFLHCRTVQVLVNQRNLVEYGSVIDGSDNIRIGNGLSCDKAHRLLLDSAAFIHTAHNLISQHIFFGYSLGT